MKLKSTRVLRGNHPKHVIEFDPWELRGIINALEETRPDHLATRLATILREAEEINS